MQNKTVLFYWSRGAEVRRDVVRLIGDAQKKNEPAFLNALAKELELSHVAVKKHLDLLVEEGYVESINPDGKPVYLKLSASGKAVYAEIRKPAPRP